MGISSEAADGSRERMRSPVHGQGVDKAPVNLENADGKEPQVGARRVAGGEVVECDAHALPLDRQQNVEHVTRSIEQNRSPDLDHKLISYSRVVHHARDRWRETRTLKLARRDVDADPESLAG